MNGNGQQPSLLASLFGAVTEVGVDVAHQWASKEFAADQTYLPSGASGQPMIAGQPAPVSAGIPIPMFNIFGQEVSRGTVYAIGFTLSALLFTTFLVTRR